MQPQYYGRPKPAKPVFGIWDAVVIVLLLVILAAILFPVFVHSHSPSRRAICGYHAKQLATAFLMYAQDWDERLPAAWEGAAGNNQPGGWTFYTGSTNGNTGQFQPQRGLVYPYVKNVEVFSCPSDPIGQGQGGSYAYNALLTRPGMGFHRGMDLNKVRAPTRTVLLAEEQTSSGSTDDGYFLPGKSTVTTRHGGNAWYTFADGHLKAMLSMRYPNPKGAVRFEP